MVKFKKFSFKKNPPKEAIFMSPELFAVSRKVAIKKAGYLARKRRNEARLKARYDNL